jgi:hypothetical protein
MRRRRFCTVIVELRVRHVNKLTVCLAIHEQNFSRHQYWCPEEEVDMKRVILAAATCLALAGAAVGVFHGQTALTETDLAIRDHDKVVSAIKDMCTGNSVTTNQVDIRAQLISNKEVVDPAKSLSKPTTFQMAAANYSAELRDQRIKLDQEIAAGQSESWWFKVVIAACGGLAAVTIGLKPLFEKAGNASLNTGIAAAAVIFSGTVGTLSSLSAFADTQAQLLQHHRTLAQLQQLHWRVGNDVFAATSLCEGGKNLPPRRPKWISGFSSGTGVLT